MTKAFALIFLLATMMFAAPSNRELAKSPFLIPYIEQLKKETTPADLEKIKGMAESELVLLHHGYGTGIRNKWLRGNRDPKLFRFFLDNGINNPDGMSTVIIYALWIDLNSNMTSAERATIDAKRAVVARKRATYIKLESECEAQLAKSKRKFKSCYDKYGLPSKNPENIAPFYELLVNKTGRVNKIVFFDGANSRVKQCLQKPIQQFKFSEFQDGEMATLYIIEFPRCRVSERDTLHQ